MRTIFLLLLFYFAVVRCRIRSKTDRVDVFLQDIVENDVDKARSEETKGLFEGDIVMDKETERYLTGGEITARDAVVSPVLYWPKGIVYYKFDEALGSVTVDIIKQGIHHLKKRTCLKFVELPKEDSQHKSYVKFFSGDGCYSRVGRDPGDIEQTISIGIGCERIGTVVHEIMHALGFFHEHTRPDRDKYINIDWKNIEQEHARNFQKYPRDLGSSFGKPYDYESVMHYSKFAFSKDRNIPTILPTDEKAVIGQRMGLSYYDREEINKLYECQVDCVDKRSPYKCMLLQTLRMCSSPGLQNFMIDECPKTCNFCARRDNVSARDSTSSKGEQTMT